MESGNKLTKEQLQAIIDDCVARYKRGYRSFAKEEDEKLHRAWPYEKERHLANEEAWKQHLRCFIRAAHDKLQEVNREVQQ